MTSYSKEKLYQSIIDIDDKYIEEAQETKQNRIRAMWKRYMAIAACLCLAAVAASAIFYGNAQPMAEDEEIYNLRLFQNAAQGQEAREIFTLSYTDNSTEIEYPITRADGARIPAVFVPASSDNNSGNGTDMTLAEAASFAYMDVDTAPDELQEKILAAREVIIYSKSWVADGFACYILSPDGTQKTVPSFSELFPGWEIPTIDIDEHAFTLDGLGEHEKYGILVAVSEINTDYMVCQTTSSLAPFAAGQSVHVYFPANFDASCVEKGKTMMVSFYGKDCDGASGTVYAQEIWRYDQD